MRKQTDYAIKMFGLSTDPSRMAGSFTSDGLQVYLKQVFPPEHGWEMFGPAQFVQVITGEAVTGINVLVTMVRYEEVDSVSDLDDEQLDNALATAVKRGRGRPKKVEVEPA